MFNNQNSDDNNPIEISNFDTSGRSAFSNNQLDRRSENRPEGILEATIALENTRYLAFFKGRALVKDQSTFHQKSDLADLAPDFEHAAILGWDNEIAYVAVTVTLDPENLPDFKIRGLVLETARTIYSDLLAGNDELGILAQGTSINAWIETNRHCGVCGAQTMPRAGGYNRKCSSCERVAFPRTDPVVIMCVIDKSGDRCLLGRSPHFAPNMYSTLAGFVEPAETIEDAVRRETLEEAGIHVGEVRYHASQPWPMPHTLMIGCYGQALDEEINFDTEELADCRWFTKAEVKERLKSHQGEERLSPPEGAIAHLLMKDWVNWAQD